MCARELTGRHSRKYLERRKWFAVACFGRFSMDSEISDFVHDFDFVDPFLNRKSEKTFSELENSCSNGKLRKLGIPFRNSKNFPISHFQHSVCRANTLANTFVAMTAHRPKLSLISKKKSLDEGAASEI